MKPIYEPKGAAKEYGDLANNIYTGCPHRCYYCFAPKVLRKDREEFHSHVEPRPGIVEAVKKQLESEQITGKLIHLCFTCDPYPTGYDTTATREIIKAVKSAGNHVQILTKGDGSRDFDILENDDWYGVTISNMDKYHSSNPYEPNAVCIENRLQNLWEAHEWGIKTWVSCEPVINAEHIIMLLNGSNDYIDRYKIGKLNYHPSDINLGEFGREAEKICKERGLDYYIKDSLRAVMESEVKRDGFSIRN
jgi:DNA repair photolyase